MLNCDCSKDKVLVTQWQRSTKKNPWTDPTYPHDTYGTTDDIHAIRMDPGDSRWKQIRHSKRHLQNFDHEIDWDMFKKDNPQLCCCGES